MDKVQKIKEMIERLKDENSIGLCEYDAGYCNGVGETCDNILKFIDSLQEEQKFKVGDKIKLGEFTATVMEIDEDGYHCDNAYIPFSVQDYWSTLKEPQCGCEIDFTTKNEDLEEEIENYFSDWLVEPEEYKKYSSIARHFAEWQKQQMKEALQTEYRNDMIEDFKDYMEKKE